MALADALLTVSKKSSYRKPLEKALKNYISYVAPLQHKETGYWYQLMTLPNDPQNFDESSSTIAFKNQTTSKKQQAVTSSSERERRSLKILT
jgi:rhamnogalacturonyl hydrolase YesR